MFGKKRGVNKQYGNFIVYLKKFNNFAEMLILLCIKK